MQNANHDGTAGLKITFGGLSLNRVERQRERPALLAIALPFSLCYEPSDSRQGKFNEVNSKLAVEDAHCQNRQPAKTPKTTARPITKIHKTAALPTGSRRRQTFATYASLKIALTSSRP